MKKNLLLITASLISISSAVAQCTITPSCTPSTTSGYCTQPLVGTTLPAATVGSNYTTVIQVSLGTTALDGAVSITGAFLESATLPTGLTYSSNPGSIAGGMDGCIEISGIPTEQWLGFNVSFEYTVLTDQGEIPQTLNYTMNIDASTASLVESTGRSFSVYPNPSANNIQLTVEKPTTLKVQDILGNLIKVVEIDNEISLSIGEWKSGLYFITSAENGDTIKLIKQ